MQLEQFKKDAMENQLQQVENMGGPVTPHATLTAQWKAFGWADTEEDKDTSAASKLLKRQSSVARCEKSQERKPGCMGMRAVACAIIRHFYLIILQSLQLLRVSCLLL